MKIKTSELKKALEIVKPGLSTLEVIEQSTSFAFINGNVVTFNNELSVSHPVALDITGAVKADLVYKYLSKVKTEEVEIEATETELIIKSGRATSGFAFMQDVTLPIDEELKQTGKWKTIPEKFLDYLKSASLSCSKDMSTPIITCVHVNGVYVESTDNFRLSQYILNEPIPVAAFLLPASSVPVVVSSKPTKIATGDGWIHFKNKENTVISCRILAQQFINTEQFIKTAKKGTEITLPENMKEVIDRAMVFIEKQNVIDEELTLVIGKKSIEVSCESETGWFKETIKHKGEHEFQITVAPSLLKNIMGKTNICYVLQDKHILYFKGENWIYITMLKM